jgi:putative transposase
MKQSYEHYNHAKFKIRYHLIFSTKYRKQCLKEIIEDVKQSFKKVESMQRKWSIETMEIDREKCDHIHILIKATPSCRVDEIVHKLKQNSTYDMWQKHNQYLSKFYWSGKHYLWTRGYFCSSLGDISEKVAKTYIENQG